MNQALSVLLDHYYNDIEAPGEGWESGLRFHNFIFYLYTRENADFNEVVNRVEEVAQNATWVYDTVGELARARLRV